MIYALKCHLDIAIDVPGVSTDGRGQTNTDSMQIVNTFNYTTALI